MDVQTKVKKLLESSNFDFSPFFILTKFTKDEKDYSYLLGDACKFNKAIYLKPDSKVVYKALYNQVAKKIGDSTLIKRYS